METRVRKQTRINYADDSYSDDDSDSQKKRRYNKKRIDSAYQDPKIEHKKRKNPRTTIAPLRPITLKKFGEIDKKSLDKDPAGSHCRFVPYSKIGQNIFKPETYMTKGERGIMTFLPNWVPGEPDVLRYFGFKKELAQTELKEISKLSIEELEKELAEIEEELDHLPKPDHSTTVIIPGFSMHLTSSIPINADVTTFDWGRLGRNQQFDVVLMDPPWQLATKNNVTRGVNLRYEQLDSSAIERMPIHLVQSNGYIFMWVIACMFDKGVKILKKWGYEIVSYMNWVKISRYGRYMPSHGYYMQHDKETLLVGRKGMEPPDMNYDSYNSLIIKQRTIRQSHKPECLYEMIENIFPNAMYLEVFARPHNLRNGWVSIGIELPI